jgi:hypothetical protein
LQALEDDCTRGAGILLEQFSDQGLEGVQLARARTMDWHGHGSLQIPFYRAGGQVEMNGDAAHGPMFTGRKLVNLVDLINFQHGCAYKAEQEATPEGCSLQEALLPAPGIPSG